MRGTQDGRAHLLGCRSEIRANCIPLPLVACASIPLTFDRSQSQAFPRPVQDVESAAAQPLYSGDDFEYQGNHVVK